PDLINEYSTQPKLEIGYAINAASADERFQVNGFQKHKVTGTEDYLEIFENGYILELKIPFFAIPNANHFVPYHGAFMPLRVTVNDNDGANDYDGGRSLMLTHGGGNTENWNAELLSQTWRWHYISSTPDQNTAIEETEINLPEKTRLLGNYPNPFNPSTSISYELKQAEHVNIVIFDTRGREVKKLVNSYKQPGEYHVLWNGKDKSGSHVSTGVFFVRFKAGTTVDVRKMLFAK
ncbi:MAG: T9SS C-terminal target domain-containing protein, partial [Calditrichaeota bacterium]